MAGVLDLPTLVQRVRLSSDTRDGEAEFTGSLDRIGSKMTKVGAGLTAGLTVPIVGLAISGVKAASDLAESNSKVGVVFEENAAKVRAFASTSASSLGISEQAALEATGTFGNLFRALGVGTGPAAEMSTSLVTLAADLASFNNANPEDVLLALRSGLLGEAEPLRQFGVSLSAARIEAEALSSGIVKATGDTTKITAATIAHEKAQAAAAKALEKHGKESLEYRAAVSAVEKAEGALAAATAGRVPELTAAQKAQAAYAIIQKDTALAQGDFARTSDGLANQQRILAAQFVDLKASLAQELLPVISRGAGLFIKLFKAIEGLSPQGQKFAKVGLAIAAAIGPVLIIAGQLAKSFGAIKAVITGGGFLLGLGPLLPVALAVGAAAFLIYKNWEKVKPVFDRVVGTGKYLVELFTQAYSGMTMFDDGSSKLVTTAIRLGKGFASLVGGVKQVFTILKDRDFKGGGPFAEDSGFIDGVFKFRDAVTTMVPKVIGFIRSMASAIAQGLGVAVDFIQGRVVPVVVRFAGIIGRYVGNVVAYFQEVAPQVREALGHVIKVISVVLEFVKDVIQAGLGILAALWRAWGDDLFNIVKALFRTVGEVIRGALGVVKGIIQTVLAVINGDWGKAWDGLKAIVDGVWDAIFGILRGASDILQSIFGGIAGTISEVWSGLWEGIKDVAAAAWRFIAGNVLNPMIEGINKAIDGLNLLNPFGDVKHIPPIGVPAPTPTPATGTGGSAGLRAAALGGSFRVGDIGLTGERGPELEVKRAPSSVLSASRLEGLLAQLVNGGGGTVGGVTFAPTIHAEDRRSGQRLGRDLAWGLAEATGRHLAGSNA